MDEWLKILLSTLAGLLAGLIIEPLKAIRLKRKLRLRLYYEIVYMHRAFIVALAECNNFLLEQHASTPETAMERVQLITRIQQDFNQTLTFEVLEAAKTQTPELFYDLKEFPAINKIYRLAKMIQVSMSEPSQFEYQLRITIRAIELPMYDRTFDGLLMEEAVPPNMQKQVRALLYQSREPLLGKPEPFI